MLLFLLACAARSGSADDADSALGWFDPTVDDDWSALVPDVAPTPDWSAAQVAAEVDRALAGGLPGPELPLTNYRELLTHGDATCPGRGSEGFEVLGVCTATSGYRYSGVAGLIVDDDRTITPEGTRSGMLYINTAPADYVIERPDGTRLAAGGTLTISLNEDAAGVHARASISGTWIDDGDPTWLAAGFSGLLGLTRNDSADGHTQLDIDGSLSVGGASLEFSHVQVAPDVCPEGVRSGAISVRKPDSSWYLLRFPAGCGACGTVTWQDGSEQGEACIDPSPLLAAARVEAPL